LLRQEYRKRGYDEVITPNMYKADLWKTSGHWDHYAEGTSTTLVCLLSLLLTPDDT
jgi:threonyl-tRNA synthetase